MKCWKADETLKTYLHSAHARAKRPPTNVATGLPYLHPGHAAEILAIDHTAKTTLLLNAIANALLHRTLGQASDHTRTDTQPATSRVLLLDADGSFDPLAFALMLRCRIERRSGGTAAAADTAAVDVLVASSLGRLHVLRCSSHGELLVALKTMSLLLGSRATSLSEVCPDPSQVVLVAIDSISRFQWLERSRERVGNLEDARLAVSALITELLVQSRVCMLWSRQPDFRPDAQGFPTPSRDDPLTRLCSYCVCLRRRPGELEGTIRAPIEAHLVTMDSDSHLDHPRSKTSPRKRPLAVASRRLETHLSGGEFILTAK